MAFDPESAPLRLTHVLRDIWETLALSAQTPGHPWRTPVLATVARNSPTARIVVLRSANRRRRQLEFHTDSRSPKVEHLRKNPRLEWVFYDPKLQMQLRAQAKATLHEADSVSTAAWKRVPPASYLNYLQQKAPGSSLDRPSGNSPLDPRPHPAFTVVHATVTEWDWLWLHPKGHRRARFTWQDDRWHGEWIVP